MDLIKKYEYHRIRYHQTNKRESDRLRMKARHLAETHPNTIYIVPHPDHPDCVKIGKSCNMRSTCRVFNKADPYKRFNVAYSFEIGGTDRQARDVEKYIHYSLHEYRIKNKQRGEWFQLTADHAASLVQIIISQVGVTDAANDNRLDQQAVA